jgi:threonine/homoserine/homoserine lactone efflux protein
MTSQARPTGLATSVMNPKGILLFVACLPQFVSSDAGNVPAQLLVIGVVFIASVGLENSLVSHPVMSVP